MSDVGIDIAFTLATLSVGSVALAVAQGDRNWGVGGLWLMLGGWLGLLAGVTFFLAVVFS